MTLDLLLYVTIYNTIEQLGLQFDNLLIQAGMIYRIA